MNSVASKETVDSGEMSVKEAQESKASQSWETAFAELARAREATLDALSTIHLILNSEAVISRETLEEGLNQFVGALARAAISSAEGNQALDEYYQDSKPPVEASHGGNAGVADTEPPPSGSWSEPGPEEAEGTTEAPSAAPFFDRPY